MRRRRKWVPHRRCPLSSHPDFVASLRLLVERERYSFEDIASMFDVTRERVRQWCQRHGITHPDPGGVRGLSSVRLWDDAAHRFAPVPKTVLRDEHRARQRAERLHARHERRRQWEVTATENRRRVVAIALELQARFGHTPTLSDIAGVFFGRAVSKNSAGGLLAAQCGPRYRGTRECYRLMKRDLEDAGILLLRGQGRSKSRHREAA